MEGYMLDRLTYRSGSIIGFVAGRIVNCMVRPARPGIVPPAGEYRVAPPTNDLIYGRVALMTAANAGPGGIASMTKTERPGGIASMTKQERPGAVETKFLWDAPSPGSAEFVLTTRAIAGRNCLIVRGGSELFDAIGAAGGAVITVS
jgi:hypothetical protein